MKKTEFSDLVKWSIPASEETAFAPFSPSLVSWFRARFGSPTPVQRVGWPAIWAGENCLLTASTGTGKTLAAFLPLIDQITLHLTSLVQCLYISPLKALCNDMRKTLTRTKKEWAEHSSHDQPNWTVGVRTGDSSSQARRAIFIDPPTILITTPESLALLLTHHRSRELLSDLRWIIVDELHELITNKRGADLTVSLERVERLTRHRLQRIGLSATCRPVASAARFLVGTDRSCTIGQVPDPQSPQIQVEALGVEFANWRWYPQRFFSQALERLEQELQLGHTILVFTNSRGLAERLIFALRKQTFLAPEQTAVHHSALFGKRRRLIERQLKNGELRLVASTSSLELGLDVGAIDLVVLIHPPGEVIRMLQRVGRAGHGPGRIRRGLVWTSNPGELMEATVTCASGTLGQTELLCLPQCPLDVLCQQILGMAAQGGFSPEEAFALVRRAYPFRNLSWPDFSDCLQYLTGKDRDERDWLPARIQGEDVLSLCPGKTLRIVRTNLGTILGEQQVLVRTDEKVIGQLEEPFSDRLQPGERFLLDGRCLEYQRIRRNGILVKEVMGRPQTPRWISEGWPLSRELAHRLFLFRSLAAQSLSHDKKELLSLLHQEYNLEPRTADLLVHHFAQQESVSEIPTVDRLLIEAIESDAACEYYFHTPLNRLANEVLSRVAGFRLHQEGLRCLNLIVADLGFLLFVESPQEIHPERWRQIFSAADFEEDLDRSLTNSALLRDRFRRVALTSLMLLRNPLGKRQKVGGQHWAERRLFQKICSADDNFVLLRQARREVKQNCLDVIAAREYVQTLPQQTLQIRWLPTVSPFAASWTQISQEPEELITPEEALEKLHATLMGGS